MKSKIDLVHARVRTQNLETKYFQKEKTCMKSTSDIRKTEGNYFCNS